MHHRDDEHAAFLNGVQDRVGEHPRQPPTDILFQDRPALGRLADALDCPLDILDKAIP
jgi:hypothetical protein